MSNIKLTSKIFLACVALTIFILIANVSALGVTPGRKIIDFSSAQEKEGSFKIINSENRQLNLQISVKGDLASSFVIAEQSLSIEAGQEKDVSYKINLPADLSPGTHVQEITILERADNQEGSISAFVGVVTQVYVKVPYPGKYAEAELNIESAELAQEVSFAIAVSNLGQEDLKDVGAQIEIYNSNGEKVAVISTNKISVVAGEKKELASSWKADVTAGLYSAKASVSYGANAIPLEKAFSIGEQVLDLNSVIVKDFSLGGIAKFEMDVQNKWGEDIKTVYSQTNVFDKNNKLIVDFKSPAEDIAALSNRTLFSYWDTEGLSKGVYDAVIYLRYGEKFSKKSVQFEVDSNSLRAIGLGYVISGSGKNSSSNLNSFLIIIIIVLVLLNLLWFIIFRKRAKK